ncbi:MAG: HAD-IA family hydrolase [Lachnospiraceae bacterium]|nr:HAD-IA family hydrolase [Lachnospiraceae bacterium]
MRTFIWDLDGTLLDSYKTIVDGLYDTYKEYGIELNKEEIHEHVITYSVSSFINKMTGVTGISFDEMKKRYSEIGEEKKKEIRLIPGAKETLKALSDRGDKHYVFTHRGKSTESVLKQLDIYDVVDEIVTSQSGFARKPEPDGINYFVDKYDLNRKNVYYVGDRTIDMDCAKNAGVNGILYLSENSYCKPNGSETFIVNELSDIVLL